MSASTEIVSLLMIYVGIFILYLVLKAWIVRLTFGVIGLILVILPASLAIYHEVSPLIVLVFSIAGTIVMLADAGRSVKRR